ncbi:ABC transporter ATP-binding protein [Elioraea sp.]|uniref:ABC transporter ATP-binding protein n=1 Tax=Elioraea sp. TaxID=2185103 RepID=UPI0025C6079D|nr:ABC transporter ATP-binding protein [Elioraea sp.]
MATVELRRLCKRYGAAVAVDRIDLSIAEGEMIAMVGPSGCGKTTVLRMISGLIEPDGGQVLIGGNDLTRAPVHTRNLGLVFQSYALFPHMTVFENVAFGLRRRSVREPDLGRRVGEALSLVRLDAFSGRYPRQLSGGQQQRVALARSVVTEPRVLLLDEPLSNLDAALRDEMRVDLRRLQQRLGITTVFVTHDQQEALTLADRMAVMRAGRIEQLGTPQEVYERPASAFVAGFVGRSNLFEVDATADGLRGPDGITLRAIGTVRGRMRAALRHEKLRLHGTPPPGANTFEAEIMLRSFAGAQALYVVRLNSGPEWQAEAPSNPPLAEGTRVTAWFTPDDLILLPLDG